MKANQELNKNIGKVKQDKNKYYKTMQESRTQYINITGKVSQIQVNLDNNLIEELKEWKVERQYCQNIKVKMKDKVVKYHKRKKLYIDGSKISETRKEIYKCVVL